MRTGRKGPERGRRCGTSTSERPGEAGTPLAGVRLLDRGGAGDAAAVRRPGHRRDPVKPAGRGRLTRDWDESTNRSGSDQVLPKLYGMDGDREIVAPVAEIAAARDVSRAQVALAWVLANPVITAPIVGVTKDAHLDALAAVDLRLTPERSPGSRSPTPRVRRVASPERC